MNLPTVTVLILIAAALAAAIRHMIKNKKTCGTCSGCGNYKNCSSCNREK